jgi:hypothetical protein
VTETEIGTGVWFSLLVVLGVPTLITLGGVQIYIPTTLCTTLLTTLCTILVVVVDSIRTQVVLIFNIYLTISISLFI